MKSKSFDEKYCSECGEAIKVKAVVCPKCGVPQEGIKSKPTSRTTAIVLSVLFGIFAWAYTGEWGKFFIGLGIALVLGWLIIPAIGVLIWVILDMCLKPKGYFKNDKR